MNTPPKRPSFGALQLPAIEAKLNPTPAPQAIGSLDDYVSVSFRTKRGLYLKLLQMLHHMPGNFQLQDFITEAVEAAMAKHPEASTPIPPEALAELVRKNKKLQSGSKQ